MTRQVHTRSGMGWRGLESARLDLAKERRPLTGRADQYRTISDLAIAERAPTGEVRGDFYAIARIGAVGALAPLCAPKVTHLGSPLPVSVGPTVWPVGLRP
jgi:hypothetical protein